MTMTTTTATTNAPAVQPTRLLRSVLCVPGHDEHKVERCRDLGADLILFDLEDGVPATEKNHALDVVAAHVRPGDAVRLCHRAHPKWSDQVRVLADKVDTIWLPKVTSPSELWVPMDAKIWALLESPIAVVQASVIAAHWRCCGLAFGRYDFMASARVTSIWSRLVEHAMGQLVLAAKAFNLPCSDAPCYDIADADLNRAEVGRAVEFGFTSKGCVHPSQLAYVQEPQVEVDSALSAQPNAATGTHLVGSKLVGPPMCRLASNLLDK